MGDEAGVRLASIGLMLGFVASVPLTRFLSDLLFGVRALDAATFAFVLVALFIAATAASWIPARSAAGVDPSRALRDQ